MRLFTDTNEWSALAAFLMLAAGGCTWLPVADMHAGVARIEVPAGWSVSATVPAIAVATGATPILASWWDSFDDPLLGSLVRDALAANMDIATGAAVLRQSQALRDVARAALWPSLAGTASAQHGTTGGHSDGSLFRVAADGSWLPDVFGGNRSALRAAQATLEASAASLDDLHVAVAAAVGLGYITLRSAQARYVIANDNLAVEVETQQIAQWREQAGLGSSLEAEQARALTEQTRALLPALQASIEQASHALAVLVARPPASLLTLLAAVRPVPALTGELPVSIPAETLRRRPDVRAAERMAAAALARVGVANAARAPTFAIGGSLGLNAVSLGSLTSGASVVTALVASVAAPIFDGGAARAGVRAQQAAHDEAQIAYEAAVLAALRDVEDALVALRGDRERLLSLGKAAEAATNASLLARERYSSGLVDFQTVLDTQRSQLGTQDGVASARADVSGDHVRLFEALGGGWPAPP